MTTIRPCVRTKTLVLLAFFCLCTALGTRSVYYSLTQGFCLKRIQAPVSFSDDLAMPPPDENTLASLRDITKQPFHYFLKGSQAYAFISQDGRYILKLFKLHHLQSIHWLEKLPLPSFCEKYREDLVLRRKFRSTLTLSSYKISRMDLKDECSLLYAQVLPSGSYSMPVTIFDSIGRAYQIDLAQSSFAVQRKASLVLPSLEQWIKNNDMDSAKKALKSLICLIKSRSLKGIQDLDPDLHKNAGLIGTCAIFIDIGSFRKSQSICSEDVMKTDMQRTFERLLTWLQPRSKELHTFLKQSLASSNVPDNAEATE